MKNMIQNTFKTSLFVALGTMLIALSAGSGHAAIITNGGFENPGVALPPTYTAPYQTLPSDALTGWTLGPTYTGEGTQFAVGLWSSTYSFAGTLPQSGDQFIEIEGSGWITQSVSIEAGTYTLSIGAQGRTGFVTPPLSFTLGSTVITFSSSETLTPTDGSWNTYTSDQFTVETTGIYTFMIAGTHLALQGSVMIDDVAITAVPEPGVIGLASLGLSVTMAMIRRRQLIAA